MKGTDKLKILQRLQQEGFLHQEDFEDKLKEVIDELDESDRVKVKQELLLLTEENKRKTAQIDYFTMLLANEPKVLDVIWSNFLIG